MAHETVIQGRIQKPVEYVFGDTTERIVEYGIRTPKRTFDRRPSSGPAPTYVGPGDIRERNTSAGSGNAQQKRHVSSGRGQ